MTDAYYLDSSTGYPPIFGDMTSPAFGWRPGNPLPFFDITTLKVDPTYGDGSGPLTGRMSEGQYVRLGDGTKAWYDGTQWFEGVAVFDPFDISDDMPFNVFSFNIISELVQDLNHGDGNYTVPPFLADQYILIANGTPCFYESAQWQIGVAPFNDAPQAATPCEDPHAYNKGQCKAHIHGITNQAEACACAAQMLVNEEAGRNSRGSLLSWLGHYVGDNCSDD